MLKLHVKNGLIMNYTNLLNALDFSWNHQGESEILYRKVIDDCIVYLFALILGMDNLKKISDKKISQSEIIDYIIYMEDHSHITPKNQSVILILNGQYDLAVSPDCFRRLEKESNSVIKFVKIEKMDQIEYEIEHLKKDNNQIKALWIRAHGTPVSIGFSSGAKIKIEPNTILEDQVIQKEINKSQVFLKKQFDQLEPDAPIILESCSTGKKRANGKENIAQVIFSASGGRTVYAPSEDTLSIDKSISYDESQGFKVNFKAFQPSTYFAKNSMLARMSAIWHAYLNHEIDITCEFK